MTLRDDLAALPAETRALLDAHGFSVERLVALAERPGGDDPNRVTGTVTAPAEGDIASPPDPGTVSAAALTERGRQSLARGEVALCVLAGGMATRMGGVVKALVEALPNATFLDLRLAERRAIHDRFGARPPLWLMTSHTTAGPIERALDAAGVDGGVSTFRQHLSVRLTEGGRVFLRDGAPDLHAPGHGDLPEALRASGLLHAFVERGGRAVMVANLDNLGATLDPLLVGWHLARGASVTGEVVEKVGTDRGGIPVRWNGRPVVLEEFRLPAEFDPSTVRVFNTNTFLFDARALLDFDAPLTYFRVTKDAGGERVVQFERLLGEVTSYLDTAFVRVPRSGAASRFLPVKDPDELVSRRADIASIAADRGMRGAT